MEKQDKMQKKGNKNRQKGGQINQHNNGQENENNNEQANKRNNRLVNKYSNRRAKKDNNRPADEHNAKSKSKDNISVKRIISNVIFLLSYTSREDPATVIGYIAGTCVTRVANAVYSTLIVKAVINSLIDRRPFGELLRFLLFASAFICLLSVLEVSLTHFFEIRLIKSTGSIQRKFLRKCADMDLDCYDNPEYFDDFVIAGSQSEDMMRQSITCVGNILANGLAVFSVAGILMTISPMIAAFPVVGYCIDIFNRFNIEKRIFKYDIAKKAINRKTDYSKRIFYQPEYAKEIKLTNIHIPLKNQFDDAIEEEFRLAEKYGPVISWLSVGNWIVSFTLLRFFSIPVYLGYQALVMKSITLGDVVAMKNAADIIQWQLHQINWTLVTFQQVGQYAERFRRFIGYRDNIESAAGGATLSRTAAALEIKNVSFSYDGKSNVLNNISMTIKPGEKIAIVGENGAGKTTFVKLLMRLYDACEG